MTKELRDTGPPLPRLRDTSPTLPRLDPAVVAAALGAEPTGWRLKAALAPLTRQAVREELFRLLQSGEAGSSDPTQDKSIRLTDDEWLQLKALAASVAKAGQSPSPRQIAKVLLTMAVKAVMEDANGTSSPLSHELAELASSKPEEHGHRP